MGGEGFQVQKDQLTAGRDTEPQLQVIGVERLGHAGQEGGQGLPVVRIDLLPVDEDARRADLLEGHHQIGRQEFLLGQGPRQQGFHRLGLPDLVGIQVAQLGNEGQTRLARQLHDLLGRGQLDPALAILQGEPVGSQVGELVGMGLEGGQGGGVPSLEIAQADVTQGTRAGRGQPPALVLPCEIQPEGLGRLPTGLVRRGLGL